MEVGGGVGRGPDTARRLEPHPAAGLAADGKQGRRRLQRGAHLDLAGRGLEEIHARHHRRPGRRRDQVGLAQGTRLQDQLQRDARAGGSPAGLDQLADETDIALQQGADRRHHVDLVGARGHGRRGLLGRGRDVVAAIGKVRDGGEAHARCPPARAGPRGTASA